jgi:type IV pilus assembly protein PilX
MNRQYHFVNAAKARFLGQHGISLVIVMIFLVILSVLGISAMQGSTLSSRIARNEADRNLAFQAAEAALRDGELDARNLKVDISECTAGAIGCRAVLVEPGAFNATCADGLCCSVTLCGTMVSTLPVWTDAAKWGTTGASVSYGLYTGATALPIVSRQPRYLLEVFETADDPVYRVTAVGFGANESTQVMLQSTVRVPQ